MMDRRAVALGLLLMAVSTVVTATPALLRLHPDLPLVLDGPWIKRLELFPDVPGLQTVRFQQAVWGGVVARLETAERVLERNLPAPQWQMLKERAAAALTHDPLPPLPKSDAVVRSGRAWPETPPPPSAPERKVIRPSGVVPLGGRWLAVVEVGARVDVTGFNEFFGPMGQIGVSFGRGLSDHVMPLLGFYAGFGNMRGDFEDAFGDGRTNAFGFVCNLQFRGHIGRRQSLYLEGGGGYHIRSLYWGSAFVDPNTGRIHEGRVVEQSDLGWCARMGWQLDRSSGNHPRLLDVGIGIHTMPANQWFFATDTAMFEASHRDTWIMLTCRFWDGL